LLPEEDLDEFRQRMTGWFDSLKPRNQAEVHLTERVGYFAWQIGRTVRAQSARLYVKSQTGGFEEQRRQERETALLSQRLFRAPFGRPAACPFATIADAQAGSSVIGDYDYADHPKRLVGQLEATLTGCKWLLEQLRDLYESLEKGLGFLAPERFRTFRLLGLHPIDAFINHGIARLFQALEVLDPSAGSLVREFWNEVVTAQALPELEATYQRQIGHENPPDEAGARLHVMEVLRWEIERLKLDLQMHENRAELEDEMAPHLNAVDESREGELLRRYELSCEKLFFRHMDEVYRRRAEKARRGEPAHIGGYFRPSPEWFAGLLDPDDIAVLDDQCESPGAPDGGSSESQIVSDSETELRNSKDGEGNGTCTDGQHALRNEANGVGGPLTKPIQLNEINAAVEQTLASQPPPVILNGKRRDRSHGNAVAESRRQRKQRERNRRNAERAAEARARAMEKRGRKPAG
jgi:hypothetical protein